MTGGPVMKLWLCMYRDHDACADHYQAAPDADAACVKAVDRCGEGEGWDAIEVRVPGYDIHLTPKRNPHVYLKGIGSRTVHLDARTGLHYINIFGLQRVVESDGDGWRFTGEPLPEPTTRVIKGGK